jgi:hypothetical protein
MPVMGTGEEVKEDTSHRLPVGRRLVAFAKRRPILSLGAVAAIAAVGGVELAAGALIGLGAAALIATEDGRAIRERVGGAARHFFHRDSEQQAHPS